MSGHSKWSTIKHKKAIHDANRGKLFTKVGRGITVAAGKGGLDPDSNAALRTAIEKAKQARMPKENIERAIKRAAGGGEGSRLEEAAYEGYGPQGVAFMVKVLTDNRNRTVSEIRQIFNRFGGSLGEVGSAAYVFGKDPANPQFTVPVNDKSAAQKVLRLAEALDNHDDVQEVYSNFDIPDELLTNINEWKTNLSE